MSGFLIVLLVAGAFLAGVVLGALLLADEAADSGTPMTPFTPTQDVRLATRQARAEITAESRRAEQRIWQLTQANSGRRPQP